MAIEVTHKFVSAKADGTDSTVVQPSDWNDVHDISLSAGRLLGRSATTDGVAEEIPLSSNLRFSSGSLDLAATVSITALTVTGAGSFATTDAVKIPVGTTAQRPTGTVGQIRFNTTLARFEGYTGSIWGSIGGGALGGGTDQVFYENGTTVTTDYTITSGKNAMSAGPITVNSGVTVTVPSGSVWTVV